MTESNRLTGAQSAANRIGLGLSGGGLRATMFGLGALWRLNDLGWLPKLHLIGAVSGGSLAAGLLLARWDQLHFVDGKASNFEELIVNPLTGFAYEGLSYWLVVRGLLHPASSPASELAACYAKWLFGDLRLRDVAGPGRPQLLILATSLQSGGRARLSADDISVDGLGQVPHSDLTLAQAIAASSAVPPLLSPVVVRTPANAWTGIEHVTSDVHRARARLVLTDGGVFDNLGMRTLLDGVDTALLSDAGTPVRFEAEPSAFWPAQIARVFSINAAQGEAVRRRLFLDGLRRAAHRGAFWSIGSRMADYPVASPMAEDSGETRQLARVPTARRMRSRSLQRALINWGYALADAAIRSYVAPDEAPGVRPMAAGA